MKREKVLAHMGMSLPLHKQMRVVISSDVANEALGLRNGENWCLGDSPVVGALLGCGWRGNFHTETAPLIADDMRYLPNPGGKEIRVYDYVDVRFILEDMYAKLKLFSEAN